MSTNHSGVGRGGDPSEATRTTLQDWRAEVTSSLVTEVYAGAYQIRRGGRLRCGQRPGSLQQNQADKRPRWSWRDEEVEGALCEGRSEGLTSRGGELGLEA